jgi:hypothetical protein
MFIKAANNALTVPSTKKFYLLVLGVWLERFCLG